MKKIMMIACLVSLWLIPSFAAACSVVQVPGVPEMTPVPFDEMIKGIPIIVEGTVTGQTSDRKYITFEVDQYLKGSGPATIRVTGFGWGTDCLATVQVREHGVLYLEPNGNRYKLHSGDLMDVSLVNTAEITRIVGTAPVVPPNSSTWLYALIALLFGVGLVGWFAVRQRKNIQTSVEE